MSEVCKPRICDRLICADYIPDVYLTLISLLAKGLYKIITTEKKGPDRSGLGDVGNEVFADDDVDDLFAGEVSGGENFLRS